MIYITSLTILNSFVSIFLQIPLHGDNIVLRFSSYIGCSSLRIKLFISEIYNKSMLFI